MYATSAFSSEADAMNEEHEAESNSRLDKRGALNTRDLCVERAGDHLRENMAKI